MLTCLVAAACGSCAHGESCPGVACSPAPIYATAMFQPKAGSAVSGTVMLVQQDGAVTMSVRVQGAEPGAHGLHIHEKGDCSAPDFSSAGGHFNPTGAPHACPPTEPRHAGDFGNIEVGADGTGQLDITSDLVTLAPGERSVLGRAVILHQGADDCTSQPAGASGLREACAVIELQ